MKQSFYLAWIMIRGNGIASFGSDSRKKKRFGNMASLLLFVFVFLYLGIIMSVSSMGLFRVLAPMNLETLIPQLYLSAAVIISFFFGAIYAVSIFYYSSDVEKLLPLPIRAETVISAKMIVTAAYVELFVIMFVLPAMVVYGAITKASFFFYFFVFYILLLLPLIPLCLAAVLVILLMRLTSFARNKDRFNTISGILIMVITLGIMFFIQSASGRSDRDLVFLIEQGTDNVSRIATTIFPGTSQAVSLLINAGRYNPLKDIFLIAAFSVFSWGLMIIVGRAFYFKGVIGLSSSAAKRRKITENELLDAGKSGNFFFTYILKDLRVLVRTPVFFMNNILMNFLWPVFFVIPVLTGEGSPAEVLKSFRQAGAMIDMSSDRVIAIVFCIVFALAAFVSGTNGIASSAISREGKVFYIMKTIPVSYSKQLMAKVCAGAITGLAGVSIALILAGLAFMPPLWVFLPVLLILPGAVIMPSIVGIVFDVLWPKLKWDNEQKAVKQNLNVLYGMISSLALIVIVVGPVLIFSSFWPVSLIILITCNWILNFAFYFLIRKKSSKYMSQIEV